MAAFLPFLSGEGRASAPYMVTRRVRGSDKVISYEVAGRLVEPNAMDLMMEAFALLVASGPRPVEVAAITRTQLDGDSLSLDGRGVIQAENDEGREVWVIATGETPKRRRRTITLDPRTLAALRRWLAFQQEASLAMGERLGPRALVFSLDPRALVPISPKVFSGAFARAVDRAEEAGVALPDGFHLYDMRHYGVTQLLRAGRPVAAVARRFGTSPRMIHQRYEHAIPGDDAALADTMAAVWGEPAGPADVVPLR
jgi:integrase